MVFNLLFVYSTYDQPVLLGNGPPVKNPLHVSKFKTSIESRPHIAAWRSNPKRYPLQYSFGRYVIHSYPGNINAMKAVITADYGGIKLDYPQDFAMGKQNKTPEYLKKYPSGQVPLLEGPDGPIYESNAIAKYIARKGLDKGIYGSNDFETSQVDQWLEWYRSQIENEAATWLYPVAYGDPFDKEKYESAKSKISKNFVILNDHLQGKDWIIGKRVTLVDIIFFCSLSRALLHLFDPEFLKPFPHIVTWVHKCLAERQFKSAFPGFELCTREKQPGELSRK